jgi:hypothetical protein
MRANREIAEYLYRVGTYKSYHEALTDLNEKAWKEMENA